ncbi:protein kinase C delta type-like [Engystomops pustulosus]|uniref:protein kinase C delta type-like n=1 Tax=Engystomops pustulosus TaxID=76066 RepID=UPI003AFA18F0
MSAGPGQSDFMEKEEIIIISDSSADEKTSSKSQGEKRRRPSSSAESSDLWIYPEDVPAGSKQSTYIEKRGIIIILDSSDDEETSMKSQWRKKRRFSSGSEKSTVPQIPLDMDINVPKKMQAKKRHLAVEEKAPPPKILRQEDLPEDQGCSGAPSSVQPPGFSRTSDTIIQRLQFHHVLGEGSYGKVVLVVDTISRRQFAVKIVSKRALLAKRHKIEVMVEHRVLQLASGCPFLVHADFAFQTKMHLLLGLEYMSCGDFYDFLQSKGPLNIASARFYAAELVCGIQYLHLKGVIHRDLKPGNILVAETGHLKITDFGLALTNMHGDRTATGYAGTAGFVAPEMLAEEEYNAAVDWYSFGAIVNEMVTGQCQYDPTLFNETNIGAQNIILQLLQKDPAKRLGVNGNIREHPFFQRIHWVSVEALRMPPPHFPIPSMSCGHPEPFDLNTMEAAEASMSSLSSKDQAEFRGFSFVTSKTFG